MKYYTLYITNEFYNDYEKNFKDILIDKRGKKCLLELKKQLQEKYVLKEPVLKKRKCVVKKRIVRESIDDEIYCRNRILYLSKRPDIGNILYNIDDEETIFRYIEVKKYYIFYRIVNDNIYVERMIKREKNFMKIIFNIREE